MGCPSCLGTRETAEENNKKIQGLGLQGGASHSISTDYRASASQDSYSLWAAPGCIVQPESHM
jgi:hypothetical protein